MTFSSSQVSHEDGRGRPSLQELFDQYRPRLRMLVELRIDRRIQARVDASDVVQEAFIDAARRYESYQPDSSMAPYLWLRFLTLQQLLLAHRKHLGVKARSAMSEQPLDLMRALSADSGSIANCLAASDTSPVAGALRNESRQLLQSAIDEMDEMDREVLILRHFEQLEIPEIADLLSMTRDAVASRYRRALKKLGSRMNESGTTER